MLDLKLLQNDFDTVAKKLQKKGVDSQTLDKIKTISLELKNSKKELEDLQANQNAKSKEFGALAKSGGDVEALKKELNENKDKVAKLTGAMKNTEDKLSVLLHDIPNIPDDEVPQGANEDDNVILKEILEIPKFDFEPKNHYELMQSSADIWLDFERGVKLAKSRFTVLRNDGAKLARALVNYMLDWNSKRGFMETSTPFIVNDKMLFGTGQLPKFEDDLFKIEGEDLYLIPTSEVTLTNLMHDEIIEKSELPLKFTAYSECFRKEAGSAGRDTRGMIRQHQFSKVELVALTSQEDSDRMLDEMVQCASDMLTSLGLAHRHVLLCGGDLGFGAAKTIDLEVWFPAQNKYREISSLSNTRDFQSRRAKIRYKDGKKNRLAHTLNGSSLAVGRTLIAIMENYQKKDGSIEIPKALKEYM